MIGKSVIKRIKALQYKKFRIQQGEFVAEGHKLVEELLGSFECRLVLATSGWLEAHEKIKATQIECVTEEELKCASLQQNPQSVLALFSLPVREESLRIAERELVICLDGVQDPGNMGTIARIAAWFGIKHIFCSTNCADIFAPKAIQATMGAAARVCMHYTDLSHALDGLPRHIPVYGTFLDGEIIYDTSLSENGIIVMGNEGNGISAAIERRITKRLFIPPYPTHEKCLESLNVAMATAITCSEFRRRPY